MRQQAFLYVSGLLSAASVYAVHLPTIMKPPSIVIGDKIVENVSPRVISPDTGIDIRATSTTNQRCGKNYGKCDDGLCCSSGGYCGTGFEYCSAPACQYLYGPSCDANQRPNGKDTEFWPRPKLGNVPYGQSIYHCEKQGVIAITFDDGPYSYTSDLLDLLKNYGVKATFFLTGRNLGKDPINSKSGPYRALIERMAKDGHQIASHTWSHQRLTQLSEMYVRRQMLWNEIAIADILGYFPTYMRPPYSASNDDVNSWLRDLGYHVTYFNLDTEGYLDNTREKIQKSKDIFDKRFEGKDPDINQFLHIEHDTVFQTVYNLTEYMIKKIHKTGFKTVTVGECLEDPEENWYRWPDKYAVARKEKRDILMREIQEGVSQGSVPSHDSKPSSPQPLPISGTNVLATTDGRCGPLFGHATCALEKTAPCCSKYGWCGNSTNHCTTGCQADYGICGLLY